MDIFSNLRMLENSLNYSALKHKTIVNNIANADTPNYKAKRVSFKSELNEASLRAKRTDERHLPFQPSKGEFVVTEKQSSFHHNGNNVDMDLEMAELAKNQLYYHVLVERMNGKFNSLKEVLRGGK